VLFCVIDAGYAFQNAASYLYTKNTEMATDVLLPMRPPRFRVMQPQKTSQPYFSPVCSSFAP
jgi:hypothetical protein